MAQQVVTELVIDARGAAAGAAAYDAAMKKAEAAANRVSAVNDNAQAAIERSTLSMTQSTGRQAAAWQRMAAAADPVYKATLQLEKAVNAGNAAMARGAATADQVASTLAIYRSRLDAASGANQASVAATALNAGQVQNLTFQLNDMATMLASGQSPFVMLMQQGMQMAQVFGPGVGVGGALKATGVALVSFLTNPLTLAVAGMAAAAGAVSLLWDAVSDSSSAEDALEAQKALIEDIRDTFGEAGEAATAYAAKSAGVLQFRTADAMAANAEALQEALGQFEQMFEPRLGILMADFGALNPLVQQFTQSIRDGSADVAGFERAVAAVGNATDDVQTDAAVAEVLALIGPLLELERQALQTAGATQLFAGTLVTLGRAGTLRFADAFGDMDSLRADLTGFLDEQNRAAEEAAQAAKQRADATAGVVEQLQFEADQLGRTAREQAIYNALRQAGTTLDTAAGQQIAELAGRNYDLANATDTVGDALTYVKDAAIAAGISMVTAFADGDLSAQKMADTLHSLRDNLAKSAINDAIAGNFVSAAVKGVGAAVAHIFGNEAEKRAEEQRQRQEEREELRRLREEYANLRTELRKVMRDDGTEFDQFLKDITSTWRDFKEAAKEAGKSIRDITVEFKAWKQEQIAEFTRGFVGDLQAMINTNSGKGYLNEVTQIVADLQDAIAVAGQLGVNSGMVVEAYTGSVQGVINGAELTGAAFDDLLKRFPVLNGHVKEFSGTIEETIVDLEAIAARVRGWEDKLFAATTDTSTIDGALAAIEREYQQAREAEAAQGGQALALVDAYYARMRLNTIEDFNARALALETERLDALAARQSGYLDRLFDATTDTNTLPGALAAFDREAARQRAAEVAAGGQLMADLERTLAAERLNIIDRFAAQAAEEERRAQEEALAEERRFQSDMASIRARAIADQAAQQRSILEEQHRAANDRVSAAQDALRRAYDAEAGVIKTTIDGLKSTADGLRRFTDSIRALKDELRLDKSLSPLSAEQRLAEAARQFATATPDTLAAAAQAYLAEAKDFYASSPDYARIFAEVNRVLDQQLAGADQQLSATDRQISLAEQQLSALERQVNAILGVETGVMSVASAIQQLSAALAAQAALPAVQPEAQRDWGPNPTRHRAIDAGLQAIGLQYTGSYAKGANGAHSDFYNWLQALSPEDRARADRVRAAFADMNFQRGGIIPGYAMGGIVGNGIWNRDSVLASYAGGGHIGLAGGEFVMPAPQTRAYLPQLEAMRAGGGSNDNSAVVAALQQRSKDASAQTRAVVEMLGAVRREAAETKAETEKNTRALELLRVALERPTDKKKAG